MNIFLKNGVETEIHFNSSLNLVQTVSMTRKEYNVNKSLFFKIRFHEIKEHKNRDLFSFTDPNSV
jgi:hypothetical protein